MYLFELGFQGTAYFSAQEEAGKSWRYLLGWFRRFGTTSNQLIVLDTSPFPDSESAVSQDVVLRHQDANGRFNSKLTGRLANICDRNGWKYLFKDGYVRARNVQLVADGKEPVSLGSTEMGRIVAASNGLVDGTTLQISTSGYHTLSETASIKSVAAFLLLLLQFTGLESPTPNG